MIDFFLLLFSLFFFCFGSIHFRVDIVNSAPPPPPSSGRNLDFLLSILKVYFSWKLSFGYCQLLSVVGLLRHIGEIIQEKSVFCFSTILLVIPPLYIYLISLGGGAVLFILFDPGP